MYRQRRTLKLIGYRVARPGVRVGWGHRAVELPTNFPLSFPKCYVEWEVKWEAQQRRGRPAERLGFDAIALPRASQRFSALDDTFGNKFIHCFLHCCTTQLRALYKLSCRGRGLRF